MMKTLMDSIYTVEDKNTKRSFLKKFYAFSIYSMAVPILFHGYGFYNLYQGLKRKEKINPAAMAAAALMYLISAFWGIAVLRYFVNQA